jgi:D-glycero-alpha-D-manno-heptose-7-phosphate kinase
MIIKCRAPLRISFAGGGTDVPPYPETRGGCVISSTITKYAYAVLKSRADRDKRVNSVDYGLMISFKSISELKYDGKLDLVKAAMKIFPIEDYGFDLLISCDAPPGSGLGSSSAVMVTIIGVFKELLKKPLTSYEIAELAYRLERIELGIKGGLQDQYATTFGGFNFIEFKKESVIVNPLRIKPEILNELHSNLLLFDTGKTRLSARILARQISAVQKREALVLESLDLIKQLAIDMKNALLRGDLKSFGELLHMDWEHKKKLDSQISNPFIDKLYNVARESGAIGGKICGAGGGGHLLIYCNLENRHRVVKKLESLGCKLVAFSFENNGLQTWEITESGVKA